MSRSSAMRLDQAPRFRITADEFERMVETGILTDRDHVELIDGELIAMAPKGGPHVMCVIFLTEWFTPRVAGRARPSVQNSFRLSDFTEPEPDFALIKQRDYGDQLPTAADVLLVVEVSDTTFRYDRDVKMPRYAAEGIPEAWIVDVQRRRIIVYRDPTPDGYRTVTVHTRGAVLSPLAFPDLELRWEDIFGRR